MRETTHIFLTTKRALLVKQENLKFPLPERVGKQYQILKQERERMIYDYYTFSIFLYFWLLAILHNHAHWLKFCDNLLEFPLKQNERT